MSKLDVTKKTKAFTYLMPALGHKITPFAHKIVNAFFGDEEYPELDNHIFVLYRFYGSIEFIKYEEDLEREPSFVKSYDPDKKHVMKVFKVPERFEKDYELLKDGKYSKISDDFKTRIIAFHRLPPEHPVVDVLYKREAAFKRLDADLSTHGSPIKVPRNLEASSVLDWSREIYNSNYKYIDPFTEGRGEIILEEGTD